MQRREFLAGSLATVGGLLTGCRSQPATKTIPTHFDHSEQVRLGQTDLVFSRVGLGTGMRGFNYASNQTRLGQEGFTALARGCFDHGLTWFDCADIYGSHPFLAQAVSDLPRDQYHLVSKMWFRKNGLPWKERPNADVLIERFLKELKTDHIDLVLLHCMTNPDWPNEMEEQMNILAGLKKKGIIRAHGVSCHSLPAVARAAEEPWVDSVHTRINPYRASMDDSPHKVVPVLQRLKAQGKGVVGMKMIGAGKFSQDPDKINHTMDFVLNLGCVDVLVVGFESPEQCHDFANRVGRTPRREASLPIPDVPMPKKRKA